MSVRNIFIQLFKICHWPVKESLYPESFFSTKILDLRTDSKISPPSEWHLFLTFLEFLSPLEILPFLLNEMGWEVSSALVLMKMGFDNPPLIPKF